jgi:hypothetical protein
MFFGKLVPPAIAMIVEKRSVQSMTIFNLQIDRPIQFEAF